LEVNSAQLDGNDDFEHEHELNNINEKKGFLAKLWMQAVKERP